MNKLLSPLRRARTKVEHKNRRRVRRQPALRCLRTVCILIFLVVLAGCGGPGTRGVQESFTVAGRPFPLTCEIFSEFPWQEFSFGVDTPADVASIAVDLWGVEEDQFHFENLYGGDLWLTWSGTHGRRELDYNASFGVERRLETVEVLWTPPATIAQMIDCLGAPRSYSAYYGPSHHEAILYLEFWYPDRGLSLHQSFYTRITPSHPVEPALRIDGFHVTAAAQPGQAVPSVYTAGQDPRSTAFDLCQVRPWPGSLEAIDADVEELRCS